MGTKRIALLAVAALMAGPLAANAATVTYDFTGTVESFSGSEFVGLIGMTVTGTYTFDYANATSTTGAIGASSGFTWGDVSGTQYNGSAVALPPVFSSTATVGGISYVSAAPSTYSNASYLIGGGSSFDGNETQFQSSGNGSLSALDISNSDGTMAYSNLGLPLLSTTSVAQGTIARIINGTETSLLFKMTSLTPASTSVVPLPSAVWLMLSGLGGLGALARKKRSA